MSSRTRRIAFTGPFSADHHARALDALSQRLDGGARDVLYIVATGTARRRAIGDLLARRGAVFGFSVKTMSSLPGELFRRSRQSEPAPQPPASVIPTQRWVRMPTSQSMPSGHSASAFAFATAVGYVVPTLSVPLARGRHRRRVLASTHRRALPSGRDRGVRDRHEHGRRCVPHT